MIYILVKRRNGDAINFGEDMPELSVTSVKLAR
jgi:hypothetical protein